MIKITRSGKCTTYVGTPRADSDFSVTVVKYPNHTKRVTVLRSDGKIVFRDFCRASVAKSMLWLWCGEDGDAPLPKWL